MTRIRGFSRKIFLLVIALSIAIEVTAFAIERADAQSQPTPSDDEVNAIASQLYCPVCENISLDVCQSQACLQWREVIRTKLAEGWNVNQIKTYFVQQYGDRVLAVPPPKGLNWLIYILPPIILLSALLIIIGFFKKSPLQTSSKFEGKVTSIDAALMQKLKEDLKEEK